MKKFNPNKIYSKPKEIKFCIISTVFIENCFPGMS